MIEHWDCNCQTCTPKKPEASPAPQPEPTPWDSMTYNSESIRHPMMTDEAWEKTEQPSQPAVRVGPDATGANACMTNDFVESEQPSQPAGAREFLEHYAPPLDIRDGRQRTAIVDFAEAYAKKERERADAAEQLVRDLKRDRQWLLANFCYAHGQMNLHTSGPCGMCRANNAEAELRDMREALQELIDNKPGSWRHAEALLSRKGEGS